MQELGELVLWSRESEGKNGQPVLRCPLYGQAISVGKSPTNDIALPGEAPAFLCSLELIEGKYFLVDRVGDAPPKELMLGDEFPLGELLARLSTRKTPTRNKRTKVQRTQRTGSLRSRDDGRLERIMLALLLPASLGAERVAIGENDFRLGANVDNDLVMEGEFVSSFHAEVFARGERLYVRDLDSTNGTFVDGVRVVEAELRPGRTLKLGGFEFAVVESCTEEMIPALSDQGPWSCDELTTADPEFAQTFILLEKVATHDASVCILGETGTGKELAARALHKLSGREDKAFVPLNCAALPADLIESELFGHEKGAFTGANERHLGAFEQADGGTLFLDEVGEMPLAVQAKLLRVLETRSFRRVGGKNEITVDVRVLCATHRDLLRHVRDGRFREDLLHRLYVVPLRLPPLRERPKDIRHLAAHFVHSLAREDRVHITDAAYEKLLLHPYPGNVRELKNVIQRALILGDGLKIDAADVEFIALSVDDMTRAAELYLPGMTLEDVEREVFQRALDSFGSTAEAARSLGLAKSTFWRRVTALGLRQ